MEFLQNPSSDHRTGIPGEVLKRVSGTSVQDNKFVIVRGLNERYNTSLLNNSVLPSTEPDKKAFSFDIIPASLIDNVTIYKSPTPDLPGDFAGGAVKVTTKDYPSKTLSQLKFVVGYNSLTTFKPFYKQDPAGKFDALGYFDNSRLMPGGYYNNRGQGSSTDRTNKRLTITKQFPNNFAYQAAATVSQILVYPIPGETPKSCITVTNSDYIYTLGYTAGTPGGGPYPAGI